jgi:hypothetical protein
MNSLAIGGIAFLCVFGGALCGLFLRTRLREHHLSAESKEVVKLGVGLIATMSALVLGLLVASAKSSFDAQSSEVTHMAGNAVLLDRVLAHYGPDAKEARATLRTAVTGILNQLWPADGSESGQNKPTLSGEVLYEKIQNLKPEDEAKRTLQNQALKIAVDIGQTRWLLYAQKGSAVSVPFLVVVIFWLTIIFGSFGLFAPRNAVVLLTLLVCALSVAGALYLVLELDRPFEGLIQISSEPLRNALEQLGR